MFMVDSFRSVGAVDVITLHIPDKNENFSLDSHKQRCANVCDLIKLY